MKIEPCLFSLKMIIERHLECEHFNVEDVRAWAKEKAEQLNQTPRVENMTSVEVVGFLESLSDFLMRAEVVRKELLELAGGIDG